MVSDLVLKMVTLLIFDTVKNDSIVCTTMKRSSFFIQCSGTINLKKDEFFVILHWPVLRRSVVCHFSARLMRLSPRKLGSVVPMTQPAQGAAKRPQSSKEMSTTPLASQCWLLLLLLLLPPLLAAWFPDWLGVICTQTALSRKSRSNTDGDCDHTKQECSPAMGSQFHSMLCQFFFSSPRSVTAHKILPTSQRTIDPEEGRKVKELDSSTMRDEKRLSTAKECHHWLQLEGPQGARSMGKGEKCEGNSEFKQK